MNWRKVRREIKAWSLSILTLSAIFGFVFLCRWAAQNNIEALAIGGLCLIIAGMLFSLRITIFGDIE